MKNILLVSYYFNLRDTDRAYTVFNYFNNGDYNIQALVGNYDHNSKKTVSYGIDNVKEIPVISYKKNVSVSRIISYIKFSYDVKKLIKKIEFDIAYIIGPPNSTGFLLRKIIKRKGSKLVSDIYDLYPETIPISKEMKKILKYFGFGFWSYLRDSTIKYADCFIGSCQYYFTYLGLKEDSKHKMIPLCKGEAQIENVEKQNYNSVNIVYLGALTGNYDFDGLIELMVLLKKAGRASHLDIIGDGEKKDWLLNRCKEECLDFNFYGRVYDDSAKSRIMRNCHFGFNGFKANAAIALSYKSMEYMSNGLALINSCKEDTWELVELEGIGINYTCGKIDDLVRKILATTSENVYDMQKASLKVYKERYAYHNFKEKMDAIFASDIK